MSGSEAPGPISSMTMDGDAVWVASGSYAIQYLRGKEVSCPLPNPPPNRMSHTVLAVPVRRSLDFSIRLKHRCHISLYLALKF